MVVVPRAGTHGPVPTVESDRLRWFEKVAFPAEPGGCWLWTAACFTNGYGAFRLRGRQRKAHVVAYEWFVGPTGGLQVCHHSNVKRCVRPSHLYTDDQKGNIAYMWSLGRQRERRGRAMGQTAKLSDDDVRTIREMYATGEWVQSTLGKRFGVSQRMISLIVRRERWGHVA